MLLVEKTHMKKDFYMKKLTIVFILLAILTSCTPEEIEQAMSTCTNLGEECLVNVPVEGQIELTYEDPKFSNYTEDQKIKMRRALAKLKIAINSEEFKKRVLNFKYLGNNEFVDNKGLTNEEIYQKIMEGEEELLPGVDHTMNLSFSMYYSIKKVVGYTVPTDLTIYTNSKYFNTATDGAVAGNAVHEWMHKIGFDHSYYNNSARPYSVPYAIGDIIEDLVNALQ